MNARDFALQIDQIIMVSRPSIRIARKAHSKAESDFATWLMMAKLGSFDDLPPNAQGFLISYRTRLERMSEAESKVMAVREVYASYYSEIGGLGAAPELEAPLDRWIMPSRVLRNRVGLRRLDWPRPLPTGQPPKIRAGPADFRSHGGSDCRLQVSDELRQSTISLAKR
jgi:hypothetical protein